MRKSAAAIARDGDSSSLGVSVGVVSTEALSLGTGKCILGTFDVALGDAARLGDAPDPELTPVPVRRLVRLGRTSKVGGETIEVGAMEFSGVLSGAGVADELKEGDCSEKPGWKIGDVGVVAPTLRSCWSCNTKLPGALDVGSDSEVPVECAFAKVPLAREGLTTCWPT